MGLISVRCCLSSQRTLPCRCLPQLLTELRLGDTLRGSCRAAAPKARLPYRAVAIEDHISADDKIDDNEEGGVELEGRRLIGPIPIVVVLFVLVCVVFAVLVGLTVGVRVALGMCACVRRVRCTSTGNHRMPL